MVGLVLLVVAVQVFVAARPRPGPLPVPSAPVVVVGVPALATRPPSDQQVVWSSGRPVSAAAVSEPAKSSRECAVDVWASLGAGRTTSVGQTCVPTVSGHRISEWAALRGASAVARPDARLGTLAAGVPGCVESVGPLAAVAAARPDGSVPDQLALGAFLASGGATRCPLTVVDLGDVPLTALGPLLRRTDVTVVLLGVRSKPSAQAVEALDWVGSGPPGWLTSPSTRRTGVVTLPDLTRTLVAAAGAGPQGSSLPVDGALLEVTPAALSTTSVQREVAVLRAQPYALGLAAAVLGALVLAGCLLVAVLVLVPVARRRGRRRTTRPLLAAALVLPAALALTGALPWQRAPAAGPVLVALAVAFTLVLTLVVRSAARVSALPTAVLAAGITVLVLSADAATGGLLQRGSLLNPRPLDGGRWYGFGNVTFAVYAWAVLVTVGWLAAQGRRAGAALLALLAVACEASPTMGADLGGLLALAPPLLWLLLRSRGRPLGTLRVLAVAGVAVGLGAAAAGADWLRGPQRRTHLGGFVQHLVDGSAGAVLMRKADGVVASIASPGGVLAVALVVASWWFVRRRLRDPSPSLATLRPVVHAAAAAVVVGTLLNDSGVVVGGVLSPLLALSVAAAAEDDGACREQEHTGGEQAAAAEVGHPPVAQVQP